MKYGGRVRPPYMAASQEFCFIQVILAFMANTMRLGMLQIVMIYLVTAIIEIALHFYAGMGRTATARQLHNFYLSRDGYNNKAYVAGVVDLIIPAITLGIAAGILCATWEPRRLVITVFLLCLGIVALFPIYGICYSNGGIRSLSGAVTSDDLFKVFAKALGSVSKQ